MPDSTPRERPPRILPAIIGSQFAGTALWFAGNAVLDDLARTWGQSAEAVAGLTSAVQFGFISGTLLFAVANLADRVSPRLLFLVCSLLGAVANLGLLGGPGAGYGAALASRFGAGFFLAGVYPVGMKIAAGWYRRGLGRAIGYLVGALVLGTALPHLIRAAGAELPWQGVIAATSAVAAAGGVAMYALVPDGPYLTRSPGFNPRAVAAIFASPKLRAAAFGYFGHMWELYAFWAFVPLALAGHRAAHGAAPDGAGVPFWSFAVIAAGSLGCAVGGVVADRAGSARVAAWQLGASGACCLLSPLMAGAPSAVYLIFLLFWGVVVVGDSPQFSALNAGYAPPGLVGSSLTLVNGLGFAITVASIQLLGDLADRLGTAWMFLPLAVGPALGLLALRPLLREPPGP